MSCSSPVLLLLSPFLMGSQSGLGLDPSLQGAPWPGPRVSRGLPRLGVRTEGTFDPGAPGSLRKAARDVCTGNSAPFRALLR